jgi:uncharacterized OB-fold protein
MALTISAPPIPHPTTETQPFWDACKDDRLSIPRCNGCGRLIFYPRVRCPFCRSEKLIWEEMSGRGVVYSFAVNHVSPVPQLSPPYIIALVKLDEGIRMLSGLVDCEADRVHVDLPVKVVFRSPFDEHPDFKQPYFTPE